MPVRSIKWQVQEQCAHCAGHSPRRAGKDEGNGDGGGEEGRRKENGVHLQDASVFMRYLDAGHTVPPSRDIFAVSGRSQS